MDSLIKQMRGRYSGVPEKTGEITGSTREKRIPAQKSVTFKEEKKKTQNWFQRQFSKQMSSRDTDLDSDMDHATAVAAAAYAISSLDETEQKKQTGNKPETPLIRPKSRREAVISIQEPGSLSKRLSGQDSMKSSERQDNKVPVTSVADENIPSKYPSIKKTPTFATNLDGYGKTKQEDSSEKPNLPAVKTASPKPKPYSPVDLKPPKPEPRPKTRPGPYALPKPELPPIAKPRPPPETKRQSSTKAGREDYAEADAWEKAEMAKIKQRYEKLMNRIAAWENKKKAKARRRLDRTESELDQKRKRALQKFREDMEYIDEIAGGARAQAEERRRNEELKAKEKAKKIRETGKVPATCLCF